MRARKAKWINRILLALAFAALLIAVVLVLFVQVSSRTNSPALPSVYVPSTSTPERTIPLCVQDHNCTMNGRP